MFENFDAVFLARLQFAFTISFHFIFPAFTIGLASYLAVLEWRWLRTKEQVYLDLFRFWVKIFAVAFAMGVVSGIVMTYQFGTNWAVFSDRAGPVIGPLMAYEVMAAFFLEAGFLGVMLFGLNRVGPRLHFAATLMVAFGTFLSAFWILSANSWMHTPTGFGINEVGQFVPEDWLQIIFNPSFPYRLAHTLSATYLTTALAVGGVGAWHLLRHRYKGGTPGATDPAAGEDEAAEAARATSLAGARTMFSMAMWMVAIVAPLQVIIGDLHGLNTLEHQPAKIMAMEGHYQSHPDGAPLILFGIPNSQTRSVDYAIQIPKAGSLILKHDPNAPMDGLDTIPAESQPPVGMVFWSFRIMVGIGLLMLALGAWSLYARYRRRLYEWPLLHRVALAMAPSGFVAVIAGWITTEVGRQPYTVYNLMTTRESASALDASAVGASLVAFIIVYFIVFGLGTLYILRLMAKGVQPAERPMDEDEAPIRSSGITPGPAMKMSDDGKE
ncbi:cytochrome ubiquinol oxidase subunit I [Luteimonas sp. JM171]|uniref:cytochrome ubiquinol oxidase subunit I n=1 Tax=Luteimonas sp. JM171 TaxID=1896164 RepID=UPI0008567E56|nr:cytochrome ubiquinol oxidase subunit I [Luteimonas sp. JM171]AOH36818.1 cytochrome D ubiquinol oxidase subunit I [Luteimonas sp. JM171]